MKNLFSDPSPRLRMTVPEQKHFPTVKTGADPQSIRICSCFSQISKRKTYFRLFRPQKVL